MTPDERAMVDFALRWSPFGDGDEYILPQFGLTPTAFYRRVFALATTSTDEIDTATSSLLRDICTSKLPRPTRRPHTAPTNTANRSDRPPLRATAERLP
ncbi:DUF3263 domain-containing protein [Rhodococcus sp. 2H158]